MICTAHPISCGW